MRDRIRIGVFGAALAGAYVLAATDVSAQALGTYTYASGNKTTGTMVVTDMSACDRNKALGCMSAARPLKVSIRTLSAGGNDCDLDAIEETAGRIASPTGLQTMLVIDDERSKGKPNLSITFAKGGAVVKPDGNGIGCGMGVGYDGRWRLKGK